MAEKPIEYQVTPQGSLGLLALGHVGVNAWRKAKAEAEEKEKRNKTVKLSADNTRQNHS